MSDHPILVIGRTGQLARALGRVLDGRNAVFLDREALDLSRPVTELPSASGVIIAAAYTAVDKAESEPDLATRVNATAVGEIAALCAQTDTPVVHVSTDYVFSGEGHTPWRPDDATAPLGAYGRSKLAGEEALRASGARHAILRTSWVFDGTGGNFLTTMLRLSETRDTLGVVDDQIGRPTYAGHLAEACVAALGGLSDATAGTYHVSNSGEPVSWADFATAIFDEAGVDMTVNRIPSSDYPTPAKRPAWSVMDIADFEAVFGYTLPHWREGLRAAFDERGPT